MSSPFAADSFDQFGSDSPTAVGTHSFDDGSFSNFDSTVAYSPPPIYVSGGEFNSDPAYLSSETNNNGPILPPPEELEHEIFALREWRRQNAIRLEEKEKREKESLNQIIVQAEEYKVEFHRKRQVSSETNRVTNREKEKVFVATLEKFHSEADKDYWKSIAELIPKETITLENRKAKKDQEKKPSIVVVQGPKPGKPTDVSRMRQTLLKLKQNTPPHLKQSPTAPDSSTSAIPNEPAVEAIAVA